jgi:hypothetical protein
MVTGVSSLLTLKEICILLAKGLGKIEIDSLPDEDRIVFVEESNGVVVYCKSCTIGKNRIGRVIMP